MNNLNQNGVFTFNDHEYQPPPGDLIVCNSNVVGCGASDVSCESAIYGKEPDKGGQQCAVYTYTRLSLVPGTTPAGGSAVSTGGEKACINIGDFSSHGDELSQAASTFPDGWIYLLALPEWMDQISAFIKAHPNNNFMIRLHYPSAILSADYADRWVDNLKKNAGNIPNKIYLIPVNEPNNTGDRRVEPDDARIFISALSQGLDNEGLLNTKYIITSPMIDPTSADVTGWLGDFCSEGYCDQFAAVSVAPYSYTGSLDAIKQYFPPNAPMIIAETGIKENGQVVYGNDAATAAYINSQNQSWNSQNAITACVFSYDPDRHTNDGWIYSATQTLQALGALGQSISPIPAAPATPKTVRSTIQYESCTTTGAPETVSKVPLPNLIKVGFLTTDKKTGKSFFGGLFGSPFFRPITGLLGFQGNKAAEPSIFKEFGAQADAAMKYLTPAAINVQPIEQPYTHTVTSTLCFDDADENKQAFPIKRIIRLTADGLNKVWQNGRMMAGFLAPNVSIAPSEYEHLGERYPNVLANIDANPGCEEETPGRSIRKLPVDAEGDSNPEKYDTPFDKLPKYFLATVERLLGGIPVIGTPCDKQEDCKTDINPALFAHIKLKTPYITAIQKNLANDRSGKPVGALATFTPAAFTLANQHGKVTNLTFEQSVGSNADPVQGSLTYAYAKVLQNYIDFTNCATRPLALQKDINFSCNFSDIDTTPDRPVGDWSDVPLSPNFSSGVFVGPLNDLIGQATDGQIPACVLEAVKYIETGTRTDFSGACWVNQCSAAGPFQITTGAAPDPGGGWDTHCTQCGPNWADGSRTCPDGWPGNWPQTSTDPTPCDMAASASRAVEMLIEKSGGTLHAGNAQSQQGSIILAGNRYYGSAEPISRLGGCSYGEFVYKHCDGRYACGSGNVGL